MKITALTTFIVPPRWCFLKVETDEGIVGWGEPVIEGRAHTVATAVAELSDYLIGKDPQTIEDHWTVLYRSGFYRGGPILMSALAGIDQALWDIKGKALNVPIADLLGGPVRNRIRAYSWIGGDRPSDTANAARCAVNRGFTAIKMNGTEELQFIDSHDKVDACLANVSAVREAVGANIGIGVDFHGRVHKPMAKVLIKELEPYKLMFIEEPVLSENSEALKELASLSATPIALGERLFSRWDFKRILSEGYVDIIQPDASHAGGITETRKIASMAEAYDVALALHCPLGPIALAACLQIDAISYNAFIQEQSLGIHYNKSNDLLDYLINPEVFSYENGYLMIPRGPGLGIEINETYVRERAATGHRWRNPVWRHADGSVAEWGVISGKGRNMNHISPSRIRQMKEESDRTRQRFPSSGATHKRFIIMVLLFITVVINYLDRSNLSIAAPELVKDLGLSTVQTGLIFSAFGWTYALMQIPGGWLVDKIPPRLFYALVISAWSLATLGLGVAGSFIALFILRLAVGAFEAPSYPINNRVVTTWFPDHERATAIGFYTSGQFVGLAFLTPCLVWLQYHFGWSMVFVITGLVGVVWAIVWYILYRDPRHFPGINEAEIEFIQNNGGLVDIEEKTHTSKKDAKSWWKDFALVLSQRKLWGIYIGQFAVNSTLWFFLTWFPTYLVTYRNMDFIKSGWLASLPFLAAFTGVLCSGLVSDWMIRRGASLGTARKTPIIIGLLISSGIIGANYATSTEAVIVCLTIAFFGNGFASITWSLVSALAPERLLGLTGGMFNLAGNLAAIITPIMIGFLVREADFSLAITYIAAMAVLGCLSYVLLVGKVERIKG